MEGRCAHFPALISWSPLTVHRAMLTANALRAASSRSVPCTRLAFRTDANMYCSGARVVPSTSKFKEETIGLLGKKQARSIYRIAHVSFHAGFCETSNYRRHVMRSEANKTGRQTSPQGCPVYRSLDLARHCRGRTACPENRELDEVMFNQHVVAVNVGDAEKDTTWFNPSESSSMMKLSSGRFKRDDRQPSEGGSQNPARL
jgi:hypothetical protein